MLRHLCIGFSIASVSSLRTKDKEEVDNEFAHDEHLRGTHSTQTMSRTCECALHGKSCVGETPVPRVKFDDSMLIETGWDFHKWIQPRVVLEDKEAGSFIEGVSSLSRTPWIYTKEDQTGWGNSPTGLPEKTLAKLVSKQDLPGKHSVYLTYDDAFICEDLGCNKHRDFLDRLDHLGVKVSMFVMTKTLEKDTPPLDHAEDPRKWYHEGAQEMVKEYVERGHTIGSHTHDHPPLDVTSFAEAVSNITKADELLRKHTGMSVVKHFRAPYLKLNDQVIDYLVNTMDYKVWGSIIGGNSDWGEWELPSSKEEMFAVPMAQAVQDALVQEERREREGSQLGTFSTVLCLHDRPHELRNIKRVVQEICLVCPQCQFPSIDGKV